MLWVIFLIIAVAFLALLYRRNRGLSRTPVSSSDLSRKRLRTDNLSKEVELAWEAGEVIEFQPGADARTEGPVSDRESPARDPATRTGSPRASRDEDYFLPEKYGMDRLVLMARDPEWIYAYWEITHDKYRHLVDKRLAQWGLSKPALRIYDVTRGLEHMDIVVAEDADNWYIHVDRPEHTIVADLGRLVEGEFVPFIRSNPVTIPARTYSMEAADELWGIDWERHYGNYVTRYYASSPMLWRK